MAEENEAIYSVKYLDGERETSKYVSRGGKALVTYSNGDTFEGHYTSSGDRHGSGTYTYKLPEDKGLAVYHGEYVQGKKHGLGSLTYPNGDKYEGMWQRDSKHGDGTYIYSNGDIFTGKWVRNQRNGRGAFVHKESSSQLVGLWSKGKLQSGQWVHADGTVYAGPFSNNQPKGKGLFTFTHGNQQEGEFIKVPGEEDEEEGITKPQLWSGSIISKSVAPFSIVTQAHVPPSPFVPTVDTLSLVNIEGVTLTDGNEIITIANQGEKEVNLKGVSIGIQGTNDVFMFLDDMELQSGKRVRILSGEAGKSPPAEEEDIINIVWDAVKHFTVDSGTVTMWVEDESKTQGIVSTYAFSSKKDEQ